jgi:DNA repair protein SbcC/Rad50
VRPLSITLEGFSAYRRRQTVDLETAEFFSLSGPTGSGKSSLIDGMIFALYGRVPRLGARAVAPVISAGSDRARVSLHFEVRGERYVVSRIAERTDSGATVREARLESGAGTPMASGAGEVTRAVEELLRLRFEDFTKTVVLPQGDFARFLNAGSRERRDLLRDLLGLDVYARVRDLANERKAEAAGRAASARSQLESLEVPEPSDLDTARERMADLETLAKEIGARLEELEDAESFVEKAQDELEFVDEARRRLGDIHPPPHLDELDERLVSAREAESLAIEALEVTHAEAARLEAEIDSLPSEETIGNVRATHEELGRVHQRIVGIDLDSARATVEAAEETLVSGEARLADAERAAAAARVTHAAHTVGETLVVGRPCPVCAREVESIPELDTPPGLDERDRDVAEAKEAIAVTREDLQRARARATEAEARSSELTELRSTLVARLATAPSLEELSSAEASLQASRRSLKETRAELEGLEGALKRARRDHEEAAEALATVGKALRDAHVLVARLPGVELDPPNSGSDDPLVEWKEFLTWRDTALDRLDDERRLLVAGLEEKRERASSLRDGLIARLGSVGLAAEKPYDVTVARELEVARSHLARLEEATERAAALNKQLGAATRIEARAGALANHLRANGFERWLMAGAIAGLVGGANELLAQLSGGGFSLEADEEGSFRIVDHRNADELREVATLSGGETFLVSLALSLALAETLSAAGGGGLDAIILDEGFGTLDEESLDVVAAVLEELAGRGLMVGVITHVKELAARAPVRYQVTREPEGSTVEMME